MLVSNIMASMVAASRRLCNMFASAGAIAQDC